MWDALISRKQQTTRRGSPSTIANRIRAHIESAPGQSGAMCAEALDITLRQALTSLGDLCTRGYVCYALAPSAARDRQIKHYWLTGKERAK